MPSPTLLTYSELLEHIRGAAQPSEPVRTIGIGGGVAVGKTTIASQLATDLGETTIVSTDVFLLSNAELDSRGLTLRKGFPESYDWDHFMRVVERLRAGRPVTVASYSHLRYDIEPGVEVVIEPADTVIVEGVNALQLPPGCRPGDQFERYGLAVYIDVPEATARIRHRERLRALIRAAADQPESFYHPMADMSDDDIDTFATSSWDLINAVNLREHIEPSRANADFVLVESA